MRPLIFAISSGILLAAGAARAAPCVNPAGDAGDQVYNTTYNVMQYCNGSHWVAMGSVMGQGDNLGNHTAGDDLDMSGNLVRNLAPPSANTDAATKHYVDNTVAGLLPVCTAAGQSLVWSGTAWACDDDSPPAPGPTQQCLKTVISSETFSAHMVNAVLDGAPSLHIHYVMIGGGGGAGTGVACTSYPSSYGTGGGGGGNSAIVKDGTAVDVANGGKGGGYSSCSGLDGQSKSGSFTLSQSDTLAFYVGGGGGGAGYFAGRGGGGGAGWYGGGGGAGNGTNAGGGNGGGASGGAGGTAGGTAGSAGSQFTGGTGSGTYGGKGGDQGNGGIQGAGNGGGGGGYGGGGGGWGSSNDNSGGSNGGNAPNASSGGQGAINWADHNNMTLPSAAGKGGEGASPWGKGGNGGLIIYSYEHTNCYL